MQDNNQNQDNHYNQEHGFHSEGHNSHDPEMHNQGSSDQPYYQKPIDSPQVTPKVESMPTEYASLIAGQDAKLEEVVLNYKKVIAELRDKSELYANEIKKVEAKLNDLHVNLNQDSNESLDDIVDSISNTYCEALIAKINGIKIAALNKDFSNMHVLTKDIRFILNSLDQESAKPLLIEKLSTLKVESQKTAEKGAYVENRFRSLISLFSL